MLDDYYATQLNIGEDFERFVVAELRRRGVSISRHADRAKQFTLGDTSLGIEIKYDRRLADTGNLYIEVAEKKHADNKWWIPSGIEAASSAPWYGIGDRVEWYVFRRKVLRDLRSQHRELIIPGGTSRGFLLTRRVARKHAARVIKWEIP